MSRTDTRQRILAATVRTLAELGFARTTARSIAKSGGFAPGVIYYHFADLDDLFVATVEVTSADRFARYQSQLDGIVSAAGTVPAAAAALRRGRRLRHAAGAFLVSRR